MNCSRFGSKIYATGNRGSCGVVHAKKPIVNGKGVDDLLLTKPFPESTAASSATPATTELVNPSKKASLLAQRVGNLKLLVPKKMNISFST